MKPPYPAPYWDELTESQQLNDLVHKIAQLYAVTYQHAFNLARGLFPMQPDGKKTWTQRVKEQGKLAEAIETLIKYHKKHYK